MDEVREATARRVWQWAETGPILEELRLAALKNVSTAEAIASFNLLFRQAIKDHPPRPESGMVEMQRWFARARQREQKKVPPLPPEAGTTNGANP